MYIYIYIFLNLYKYILDAFMGVQNNWTNIHIIFETKILYVNVSKCKALCEVIISREAHFASQ